MNKLMNILAALALTAAALATPSAFAVGAMIEYVLPDPFGLGNDIVTHYVVIDQDTATAAENLVRTQCLAVHMSAPENCDGKYAETFADTCVGFSTSDRTDPSLFSFVRADTPAAVSVLLTDSNSCSGATCFSPGSLEDITASEIFNVICDTTGVVCPADQLANTENNCGECPTDTHAIVDVGGTDTCMEREVCDATSEIQDTTNPLACMCADTHEQINGVGDCLAKCGDNSDRIGTTCMCKANHSSPSNDGRNCIMDTADGETPQFTFSIDGDSLADTTAESRYEIAADAVGDVAISINTTLAGVTYEKDANSSPELQVSPAGIVSFINADSITAGAHDIFIAASQNQTIIATISLYLTVAEMMMTVGDDETPEFTFSVGGDALQATVEDNQFIISMTAAANTAINIATTLADVSYAIITEGSSDVLVLNNGVVSFTNPDSVGAGSYQFFVAATQNGTIIATIALYLTIAATDEETGEGTGNSPQIAPPDILSPEGRSTDSVVIIGISSGMLVFMSYYLLSEYVGQINWSPSYAFEHNNGNMSYSVGSRWTAAADNWRFYWQTNQNGGDNGGEFRYGSGMQYHNGIFLAALNSQSDKENTDVGVSFSANQTAGLWQLGGRYNFDLQSSDMQIDTQNRVDISADYTFGGWFLSAAARHDTDNRLNVSARYVVDKWILSTNANSNGKTTTAKVNYSYRF